MFFFASLVELNVQQERSTVCFNMVEGAWIKFAVRQVCKKYLANGRNVFWAFMDLEKAYDTVDLHRMWQMQRVYGVGVKLLKTVQVLYKQQGMHQCRNRCEGFPDNVGLRQGCEMSPWLFKVKVKSSMAKSLPVENLLPQNVGSIINYLQ